jgi:hypothetical protein
MRAMIARVLRAAAERLDPKPPPPAPVWPVTITAPGWPMGTTTTTVNSPVTWLWHGSSSGPF